MVLLEETIMKIFELIYRIEREIAIEQLNMEGLLLLTEEQIGGRIIQNTLTTSENYSLEDQSI